MKNLPAAAVESVDGVGEVAVAKGIGVDRQRLRVVSDKNELECGLANTHT